MPLLIRLVIFALRAAIVGVILYAVYRQFFPATTFRITVDRTGVTDHRGIKTPEQQRLLKRLQSTRFVEGQVQIFGRYSRDGRLHLTFRGQLSPETEQQVRNFLADDV